MRMNKKSLLVVSAVGGASALSLFSYCMTKKLLSVALDRNFPGNIEKAKKKISRCDNIQDFFRKMTSAGALLKNREHQIIEIKGKDGTGLVAHWFPSKNSKRIVIAMHGWRSTWNNDFGTVADFLRDNDCSVLYAEQRGQGKSGGEYMGFGMLERYDCISWSKWIYENVSKSQPVYWCGVSMGATTVLMASSLDVPSNVCGIIADCGFTSPYDIWKYVAEKNLHISYKLRSKLADLLCKRKISFGSKDCSSLTAMGECKIPVLFVHGTDDSFVPINMTFENYKACTAPKHLFIVPGANHGMSYYKDKDGYEKAVLSFWKKYDAVEQ